jgi:N-acetylglucosamine-6-phosphate deacetylase
VDLGGHTVAPGFVDLQVNGGGDVLFNDAPTPETVEAIVRAHRRFGTVAMLPTFVTGDPTATAAAIDATEACIAAGMPEVLGIHLEGPFLDPGKAGVHDPALIRGTTDADLALLRARRRGRTLVTLAPETVSCEDVAALAGAGVLVSAGHTGATFADVVRAAGAGLSGVTHLFNAMSGLGSREPGVVGAALALDDLWCGVIADGRHVHFETLKVAWRAKRRGRMLLVTDAMPPVGGTRTEFRVGPHVATVADGRCTTADGTLAGSVLDMASAVRNCVMHVGIPKDEALRMASAYPAAYLGLGDHLGALAPGYLASFVILDADLAVAGVAAAGRLERFRPGS